MHVCINVDLHVSVECVFKCACARVYMCVFTFACVRVRACARECRFVFLRWSYNFTF
eukprot:m.143983 g.143983  ORF g.143983 m.143983 type:complete len:57 (-) comp30346_c0_seq1:63-233(-)